MPWETLEQFARRSAHLNRTYELGTPQQPTAATAWGEWLGTFPWDAWGTLTFAAGEFTHDAASRAWARFSREFQNQHPLGCWFVGHEVGARGRLHLHCLLGAMLQPTPASRTQLWEWWFKRYGRAQIAGYDPERGAAHYCAKYVSKELAHYDLDLRGFTCLSVKSAHQTSADLPTWKRWRGARDSRAKPPEPTRP